MSERIESNLWELDGADSSEFVVQWEAPAHRAYLVGRIDASSASSLTGAWMRLVMTERAHAKVVALSHFEIADEIEEACRTAGASVLRCGATPIGATHALIDAPDIHALLHVVAALWDQCYFLMSAGGAWTEAFHALDLAGLESGKTLLHVRGDDAVAAGTYMDQDVIFAIAPRSIDEERCRQVLARFDKAALTR